MIKVMIADDDYLVRLDLHTQIEWLEEGYELLDDAVNGLDAMDKIQSNHPDILILDMEMPKMNGIELLQWLNESNITIKVIVLSCHDDYSNVKEAMRLGAVDYILKHTYQKEELIEVLDKTREKMAEEKDESFALGKIRILAKRKQLWDVFNGIKEPSKAFMANLFDLQENEVESSKYIITVFSVDKSYILSDSEMQTIHSAIIDFYTAIEGCIIIAAQKNRYVLLHRYEYLYSTMVIYDKLMKEANALRDRLETLSSLTLTCGMSLLFEDEGALKSHFHDAVKVLSYRYYTGHNQMISPMDVEVYTNDLPYTPDQLKQQLKTYLFDSDNLEETVAAFYKSLKDDKITMDEMNKARTVIKDQCFELLNQYGAGHQSVAEQYESLDYCETMEEDAATLAKFMKTFHQQIADRKTSTSDHMIEEMLADIKKQYSEHISLKTYADRYYVSTGHLSFLFKKSTGKTFVDYLNAYRIERAKALLLNKDVKIYEVADAVGISNYRYFTKIFKTYVKVTPKAYMELMMTGCRGEGDILHDR